MNIDITIPGLQRFNWYIDKLKTILEKAYDSEDPALMVYQENIRTPLFMLEGLTRVYRKIYGNKIFRKLNNSFKEIEDGLGSIDYYDGFYKEFITKKTIPAPITDFLMEQKEAHLASLNRVLEDNKWISTNQKRIRKINEKLNDVPWLSEEQDTIAVKKVYQKCIASLIKKYKNDKLQFNNIEKDLHEFRRELRWLSIYPQAFRGLLQMKTDPQTPEVLKKYLTKEIITSPYNVMPDGSNLKDHIILNADNFYALSWLIAELGKLKDNGLRLIIIQEALAKQLNIKQQKTEERAFSLCGETQLIIPDILERAKNITTTFFEENVLENLVS